MWTFQIKCQHALNIKHSTVHLEVFFACLTPSSAIFFDTGIMMRGTGRAALDGLRISEIPFQPWITCLWAITGGKNKHLSYLNSWICVSLCWNSSPCVINNRRPIWPSTFKKRQDKFWKTKRKFNLVFFLWAWIMALNFVQSCTKEN